MTHTRNVRWVEQIYLLVATRKWHGCWMAGARRWVQGSDDAVGGHQSLQFFLGLGAAACPSSDVSGRMDSESEEDTWLEDLEIRQPCGICRPARRALA